MRPSDFPWPYIAGVRPPAFPTRSTVPSVREEPRDIPVPVRGVSVHAEGLRPRWARVGLAITSRPVLSSAASNGVGVPETLISRLNTSPARAPVNASASSLRPTPHDSGSGWFATPFLRDSFIRNSAPITGASSGPAILNDPPPPVDRRHPRLDEARGDRGRHLDGGRVRGLGQHGPGRRNPAKSRLLNSVADYRGFPTKLLQPRCRDWRIPRSPRSRTADTRTAACGVRFGPSSSRKC